MNSKNFLPSFWKPKISFERAFNQLVGIFPLVFPRNWPTFHKHVFHIFRHISSRENISCQCVDVRISVLTTILMKLHRKKFSQNLQPPLELYVRKITHFPSESREFSFFYSTCSLVYVAVEIRKGFFPLNKNEKAKKEFFFLCVEFVKNLWT